MIFKQYTLNGKRRVSNGKCHVIKRGAITRKNLVHFRKNLKQKSDKKIQKSYINPKNL